MKNVLKGMATALVIYIVVIAISVGFFNLGAHGVKAKPIPSVVVYVLCQPKTNQWGASGETAAQYEACVSEVTQAWTMAQK